MFEKRKQALQPKPKTSKKLLPFVTQYHSAVPNLKQIFIKHWHLKGLRYEDFAILGQFCAKSLRSPLLHTRSAPVKL